MRIKCLDCGFSEEVDLDFFVKILGGATAGFGFWAWTSFLFAGTGFAMAICIAIIAGGAAMLAYKNEIVEWITSKGYPCPNCGGEKWVAISDETAIELKNKHHQITKLQEQNIKYKKEISDLKYIIREGYDEVKRHIEKRRENNNEKVSRELFTGNIHLFVTQYQSRGEEDFQAVLARYKKPKVISKIRMDNRDKSKALLKAIMGSTHRFKAGDIVAIVRGGGDTNTLQFDSYKDTETCDLVRLLADHAGVITISGIGHSANSFPIEKSVNFAQITPTDAALRAAFLIDGKKW